MQTTLSIIGKAKLSIAAEPLFVKLFLGDCEGCHFGKSLTLTEYGSRSESMNLSFDKNLGKGYKSPRQIIKQLSEGWVEKNAYCVKCGNKLTHFPKGNEPVADFYCKKCGEEFELKSKKSAFGKKVSGAAYSAMIRKIKEGTIPNFLLLEYCPDTCSVKNLVAIPKHYFTRSIVTKRAPLPPTARRAGWAGCVIDISGVPSAGRISLVKDGKAVARSAVVAAFKKTSFLRKQKEELRGWTLDVMMCIDALDKKEFTLDDVYRFEKHLKRRHPENNHVREKIREQLQVLRDRHRYLKFTDRGEYRLA